MVFREITKGLARSRGSGLKFCDACPPWAPALPAIDRTSARPGGSSDRKLYFFAFPWKGLGFFRLGAKGTGAGATAERPRHFNCRRLCCIAANRRFGP
jgi:hypothetical protein